MVVKFYGMTESGKMFQCANSPTFHSTGCCGMKPLSAGEFKR